MIGGLAVRPTPETYDALQRAYDHFRYRLFRDDNLPDCLFTLQRRGRSYGYFCPDQVCSRNGHVSDEIAMNPAHFGVRSTEEILSTLVREMVKLWQHHRGKPGRRGYHNREWAEKMKAVGLHPSDTGGKGGRETGDRMNHYIMPGGAFAQAAAVLVNQNFALPWSDAEKPDQPREGSGDGDGDDDTKSGKWFKFVCPVCQASVRGKFGTEVDCRRDRVMMERAP